MITRKILFISICFVVYTQGIYAQEDSIRTMLQALESFYNSGSYLNTELEGRRFLEYPGLNDSVRAAVHKYIAFSLIAQGKTGLAKEHFLSVIRLVPDYDLDPVYTSPKILIVFREAQQNFHSLKKFQKDTVINTQLTEYRAITYRTILFPGWEQLYQNRTMTGRIYLGAGITTLGSGIIFEFLRSSARRNYLSETNSSKIKEKYDVYNRYYKAETISFIAFAIVYIASEIDVLLAQDDSPLLVVLNSHESKETKLTFTIRF